MIIEIDEKSILVETFLVNLDCAQSNLKLDLSDSNTCAVAEKFVFVDILYDEMLSQTKASAIVNTVRALEKGAKANLRNIKRQNNMHRRTLRKMLRLLEEDKLCANKEIGKEIAAYRKYRHGLEHWLEQMKAKKPAGETS